MNKYLNNAVIYQIYPISFYDSDGDGKGDFNGIREKLPYLKRLNVSIIWLNPIFLSPFMDGGYDVCDFSALNPEFGSLGDLKNLLAAAHSLDIKILFDFTAGHTSVYHRWFKESCKAARNRYSDYYVWTDSWAESESNMLNGISERNGCVMTNYYSFQPALNYGYEKVEKPWQIHYKDDRLKPLRDDVCAILKQWIEFGFDGVRIDLAHTLIKNRTSDEPVVWLWNTIISDVKSAYPDAIFMAEWGEPEISVGKCGFDIDYLCHNTPEYNDLLRRENFSNILRFYENGHSYFNAEGKGSFKSFKDFSLRAEKAIGDKGGFSLPSGCHDLPRISVYRTENALKVFFAFMFTYKAVPQIYYGDEIGMPYDSSLSKDGGYERTGARTPMQWDNSSSSLGFTASDEPYLPSLGGKRITVKEQLEDKNSLLSTVIALSDLRKNTPDFWLDKEIEILSDDYPLVYKRGRRLIMLNPSEKTFTKEIGGYKVITENNCEFTEDKITLKGESFAILADGL